MNQRSTAVATLLVVAAMCFAGNPILLQAQKPAVPPVTFAAPVDYTTGTLPFANATADFNRDGNLDIAVVNYNSGNVSVLLGNGDGTFQTQSLYTVGTEPSAIVAVDLNGDGAPDLAVTDEIGNTIAILINDGTGNFLPAVYYAAGQAPRGIAAGSLRNDGIIDLVVANNLGGNVTVFLGVSNGHGSGNGTFAAGVNYTAHTNPKSVALGDFKNNGILDIACVNHNTNDVSILIGNGDGTFQAPVNYATGKDPRHVLAYDFNKDGKLDLAVANGGELDVSILYGNGDGTFQTQQKYATADSPRWLAVADYNNDSFLDIASSNYDSKNISVLLGTGSSVAGQAFQAPINYIVGPYPTGLVAGAFTPDGMPDIAVTVGGLPTAPNTYMAVLLDVPTTTSPTSLTFPLQTLNTTSAPMAVTLTSRAPKAIEISSIGFTGADASDFNQTNTCGTSLAANGSCTINVTFTPSNINGRSATLTITDNAAGNPVTVAVTGTATAAQLSPTSLTFASQAVGTTSAPQTITLSDLSGTAMTISSIAVTGTNLSDFAQTNNCGSGIAGKTSCTINVTFTPTASGTRTAAITVTDNAGGTSQSATLTGTGVVTVSVNPTSLTFPTQVLKTTSASQPVTLSNLTSSTVTISSFAFSGSNPTDFAQTNNCGTSLAANTSCTINVTFTPTNINHRSATLTITDSAGTQTVTLSGTSTAASFSPTSLSFAAQNVGTTSPSQTITMTDVSGNNAISITSIAITGTNASDFAETNTCGTSLAAKQSCTITVTFTPSATGARSASVSVTDNAGSSPQAIPLAGTGSGTLGQGTVSPTSLSYSVQLLGTSSAAQVVTLTNGGTLAFSITSIAITGTDPNDFSETNNCGTSLAGNASCAIDVTFTPTSANTRTAAVTITDGATNSPQTVALTGIATAVSFSPTSLTFPAQKVGTSSSPQSVTLTNVSSVSALTISSIIIKGTDSGDFSQTNTCGSSVAAKGSCTITVTFTPKVTGTLTASVAVADNGGASPQTVPLSGAGQ